MRDAVTRDPEVIHRTPVFRGTRVPVKTLFEYLENGETLNDFLEGFPTVSRELAIQVLEESKELRLARVSCAFSSTNVYTEHLELRWRNWLSPQSLWPHYPYFRGFLNLCANNHTGKSVSL